MACFEKDAVPAGDAHRPLVSGRERGGCQQCWQRCNTPVSWEQTKLRSRVALGVFYALFTAGFIAAIVFAVRRGAGFQAWVLLTALIPLAVSIPLVSYDVNAHVANYVSPLQRYYVRIMMLVPMYALNSFFALAFPGSEVFFDSGRECYEAYVLFNLAMLLLEFLDWQVVKAAGAVPKVGAEPGDAFQEELTRWAREREAALSAAADASGVPVDAWEREKAWRTEVGMLLLQRPHAPPEEWTLSQRVFMALYPHALLVPFYRLDKLVGNVRFGAYQYVLIRCTLTAASLLASLLGTPECELNWFFCTSSYVFLIVSASQFYAATLFFSLYFEPRIHDMLEPLHPLLKIGSVKATIFLGFWQGGVLQILNHFGVIHDDVLRSGLAGEEVVGALQNYLWCWEMALAAIVHHLAFNRREIKANALSAFPMLENQQDPNTAFFQSVMPHDMIEETRKRGKVTYEAAKGAVEKGTTRVKEVASAVAEHVTTHLATGGGGNPSNHL